MERKFLAVFFIAFLPCFTFAHSGQEASLSPNNQKDSTTYSIARSTALQHNIRAIHITAWWAGSRKRRSYLLSKISSSVINAVVVAVRETDGRVYIPGVKPAEKYGSNLVAIRNPKEMIQDFNKLGLYKIARIVTFRDDYLPVRMPELAVKSTDYSTPWKNRRGGMWLDPYMKKNWDYVLETAERAAKLGFDEIQFDYVRYPSEGDITLCRYSKKHTEKTATDNIAAFLKYAGEKLRPEKVKISAAIFGLTTTSKSDMGIGQKILKIAKEVDYIYPMMYPSHYHPGSYGLDDPDANPFRTVEYGLKDARKKLSRLYYKTIPYLQDFSLRHRYSQREVRDQIIAAKLEGVEGWILWNPSNRYSWNALTLQSYRNFVDPNHP